MRYLEITVPEGKRRAVESLVVEVRYVVAEERGGDADGQETVRSASEP